MEPQYNKQNHPTATAASAFPTKNPMEMKIKFNEQAQTFAQINQDFANAVELRKKPRTEFDGKTLDQHYVENERFSHSFNSPKTNKDEIRAVTGVAEKKTDVLYSEVLSSNFQPTIVSYDKYRQEIKDLGPALTATVKMSNSIETDEDYWTLYAKELLCQPAVFSEEIDVYEELNQTRKLKLNVKGGNILKLKDGRQLVHYAKKRVWTARQIYLGDTSIPYLFFQDQPFIIAYELTNFQDFKRRYGQYPNADYVCPAGFNSDLYPTGYKMNENIDKMVEICRYFNPDRNEFVVRANGVYLYDTPQPLHYTVLPTRRFTFDMNANKLISPTFAYGRAPLSSAKTLQAVNTEMLRLMIRKMRRSIEEPLLNYSNQIYGSDVFLPGAITKVAGDGDLKPLNPNAQQGITSGEYAMYNLVEEKIKEFVGAGDVQQGMAGDKNETATKTMAQQSGFLRNMAMTFNAISRAKKQATKQRLLNLLENHTEPIDKKTIETPEGSAIRDIYEKFSSENMPLPDGRIGNLSIIFTDRDVTEDEMATIEQEEDRMERNGIVTRYRFVNVPKLLDVMNSFNILVENKPLEGTEMSKVLFGEKLNQAALLSKLAGSVVSKTVAEEEWERLWDSKNFFQKAEQPSAMSPTQEQERTIVGDQTMEGVEAGLPSKPSINELNNQPE